MQLAHACPAMYCIPLVIFKFPVATYVHGIVAVTAIQFDNLLHELMQPYVRDTETIRGYLKS